ncbi:MAG: RNA polymerase sigma-70 factor [Cytophagales bacterium]|nr:RNA polymerase sigma-70 factor [Cytophagales bacterium]
MAKSYLTANDHIILKGLNNGDENAFQELYERYYHHLFAIAFKMTKSNETSEGIVQDVFVKIWQRRKKIKKKGSLKSMIYTMVRNQTIDFLRESAYRSGYQKELYQNTVRAFHHAENEVWFNMFKEQVDGILASLPPRRRAVYSLSREKGKSHEEIANALGISKQAVSNHISKALEIIRDQLEKVDN